MRQNEEYVSFTGFARMSLAVSSPIAVLPNCSEDVVPVIPQLAPLSDQVDALQAEINVLREEVEALRKRDESLNYYMNRLDEEMRLAARLQQDFLPKSLPQLGQIHFHTLFRPAGYVSGDLYDVMRLDERHVGFYMADAVGHGIPAALLTMFIKNALVTKEITAAGYRLLKPSQSMLKLNEVLLSQKLSHATFATAAYGHINTETLQVVFSRGGHPKPILLKSSGELEYVGGDGGLLGIFDDETFDDCTLQLETGDRLFIYSDGMEVAFCADENNIDPVRWRDEIFSRRELPAAQLVAEFSRYIDSEMGSLAPKDDLTLIVAEVR
jgi:phosphoserine phosphatase RsbU/P